MKQPIDFGDLALLVHTAPHKTLSAAARELGVPKSTVSRRLAALEARLGIVLFLRTARVFQLTEAGAALVALCGPAFATIAEAEAMVAQQGRVGRGKLRIAAPGDFGREVCGPIILSFLDAHPLVSADVRFSDQVVDLVAEGFDFAIRVGAVDDAALVVRTLGSIAGSAVASPTYLDKRGAPALPRDLQAHDCVVFNSPPFGDSWAFTHDDGRSERVDVRPRIAVNDLLSARDAALRGLGVARLPEYISHRECAAGRLVRVLPRWSTGERKVGLAYPQTRKLDPTVRTCIDFVARALRAASAGAMLR